MELRRRWDDMDPGEQWVIIALPFVLLGMAVLTWLGRVETPRTPTTTTTTIGASR